MVPAVKAGLVLAVGAAGVTGSYFVVTGLDPMPQYSTLKSLTSGTEAYNGKIGQHYGHFLTNPTDHKGWWEWSYRRWKKDKGVSGSFKGETQVTEAFSTSVTTALNKVCEASYKKAETTDIDFAKGTSNEAQKLGADILKYCTPMLGRPSDIGGDNYAVGKWPQTKQTALVSPNGNHEFWHLQAKWFDDEATKPTNDKFFAKFLEDKDGKKVLKGSLRDLCRSAYTASETADSDANTTENKPNTSNVDKYCSFKKPAVQ